MKKDTIYVDLDDEITTITDRVQTSKEKLIALVLPKHCAVLQSSVNMKILNKIATDVGKRVVLITSESSLLPLAGAAGLYVASTLQSKPYLPDSAGNEEVVTTIDEKDEAPQLDSSKPIGELAVAAGGVEVGDADEAPIELGDEPVVIDGEKPKGNKKTDKKLHVPNFNKFRIVLLAVIFVFILLIGGAVYAAKTLPAAKVTITTKNQSVGVTMSVTASLTATTVDLENKVVPAEVKTLEQTVTKSITATGQLNKGNKASGAVVIYNCSQEDKLGDIDRTVPSGTGISNNGFTFIVQSDVIVPPSSIVAGNCLYNKPSDSVDVIAQTGGDSYNLSARDYSVSGFGNMTATDKSGMGGGTNNLVKAVSQSDCDTAKNELLQTKTDDYKNQLMAQLSTAGLLPIRESFTSTSGEVTCNPAVGVEASQSTASLTLKMAMTGANMTGLDQLVKADVAKQDNKLNVFETGVKNAVVSVTEKKASGDIVFNMQSDAKTGMQQNSAAIASLIAGKKYGESLSLIKAQAGVADIKISYSPFWVKQTPKNTQRISVSFVNPMTHFTNLLGLDIGERRIGVARVNMVRQLPEPLAVLPNDPSFYEKLQHLIDEYQIDGLVIGLPRNLSGTETAQSQYVRHFCQHYLTGFSLPIIWQDETLSTVAAQEHLTKTKLSTHHVDALAAKVILEDFLKTHQGEE